MKNSSKDQVINFDKLITIVMPVKNGMPLLEDAIESINRQTVKPAKVILSDNNSTDNTTEFFKNNLKNSIKLEVYKSEEDIGSMQNFFRCINKVDTDYFCLLAHDDYFSDNWLEENLKLHLQNKDCITSFGEAIFVDENKKRYFPTGINKKMNVPKSYFKGDLNKFIKERQLHSYLYEFGLHNTSLFKEALLSEEIIRKIVAIKVGGDTCFTLSLLSKGSLCSTNKTKFYKRDRLNSNGRIFSKTSILFRIFILELPWSFFNDISEWIAFTYKKRKLNILFILIYTSRIQSLKKIISRLSNEIKKLIS
tara:strand:- start:46 stop:969 length:924 start_codon:yes stop_codon:yes gene_type:complete